MVTHVRPPGQKAPIVSRIRDAVRLGAAGVAPLAPPRGKLPCLKLSAVSQAVCLRIRLSQNALKTPDSQFVDWPHVAGCLRPETPPLYTFAGPPDRSVERLRPCPGTAEGTVQISTD